MTYESNASEVLDAFGIEKHVPSRFDPDKHNPLWAEDIDKQEDVDALMSLNPCPIPVNGKMATTVRFSLESDGEEDLVKQQKFRQECIESALYRQSRMSWTESDFEDCRARLEKEHPPAEKGQYRSIHFRYCWGKNEDGDDIWLGCKHFLKEVHISCPVLEQYIEEGGGIGVGEHRYNTKVKTIHLTSGGCELWSSLCGNGSGGFENDLNMIIDAAYQGQPEEVGTYKVCPHCRRIAEARFKRKRTKRKPVGPKPPTQEEIEREEQLKRESEERIERWRKEREIEDRKYANKHLDVIEMHYPRADKATREAALVSLLKFWQDDMTGGE